MADNQQEIESAKAEIAQLQKKLEGLQAKKKPSAEEVKSFVQHVVR